jgi:hypothetical protein
MRNLSIAITAFSSLALLSLALAGVPKAEKKPVPPAPARKCPGAAELVRAARTSELVAEDLRPHIRVSAIRCRGEWASAVLSDKRDAHADSALGIFRHEKAWVLKDVGTAEECPYEGMPDDVCKELVER